MYIGAISKSTECVCWSIKWVKAPMHVHVHTLLGTWQSANDFYLPRTFQKPAAEQKGKRNEFVSDANVRNPRKWARERRIGAETKRSSGSNLLHEVCMIVSNVESFCNHII